MKHALILAVRYMAFNRLRTAIVVVCVSIAIFLPVAVHLLVGYYHRVMIQRADATPLVIGAPGSQYDLILNALYFRGRLEQTLTMEHTHRVRDGGHATPVPLYIRYRAAGHPIVGTTMDYFSFRNLRPKRGSLPQVLGDVVLGATAARRLGLDVGDKLNSDDEKLYDISSTYPLRMRVVGILEETGTADDLVIFADIKTTWIIEGIGHGHVSVQNVTDPSMFRSLSPGNVVMSTAVTQYDEIRPEDLDQFHFHGDQANFPITALIALPHDRKSATILATRYRQADDVQVAIPRRVVADMMDEVLRVRRFFDALFVVVLISTGLFLALVMLLSMRIRRREFQTLHMIGCRRMTVFALQAAELAILLAASSVIAGVLLAATMWYVVRFDVLL